MDLIYIVLAILAGVCAPVQAGINSQLRLWTVYPALAALISFAVGTLALLSYSMVMRIPWPILKSATDLPWWQWTGGILGAFLVFVTIVAAPKLGAATLMAVLVAGQMAASMVLDHYGLIGYEIRPVTVWRVIGTFMLIGGVVLIRKF
jgi:transporter family-2 protein